MNYRDDPLVIGALGGSGTRVFARIARQAGFYMGADLNRQEDSDPFIDFYNAWIPLYLAHQGNWPDEVDRWMQKDLEARLTQHLSTNLQHNELWGIKNPKSIHMLELWHRLFPSMKFIHVVRNGLDITYSKNQGQFECYRELIFDRKQETLFGLVGRMKFWAKVNRLAAEFGETQMRDQYLRIRFEDLCEAPKGTVSKIFDFLEVDNPKALAAATQEVAKPKSIARWRKGTLYDTYSIMNAGRSELKRFDYWDEDIWNSVNQQMQSSRLQRWLTTRIKTAFSSCQLG